MSGKPTTTGPLSVTHHADPESESPWSEHDYFFYVVPLSCFLFLILLYVFCLLLSLPSSFSSSSWPLTCPLACATGARLGGAPLGEASGGRAELAARSSPGGARAVLRWKPLGETDDLWSL